MSGFILGFLKLWLVCHFSIPEVNGFKIALKQIDGGLNLISAASWARTVRWEHFCYSYWIQHMTSIQFDVCVEVIVLYGGQVLRWTPEGLICGPKFTKGSQCHLNQFLCGSPPVSRCNQWKVLMSAPHLPSQQLPYMEARFLFSLNYKICLFFLRSGNFGT